MYALIIFSDNSHIYDVNNIKDIEFINKFGQNLRKIRSSKKLSQESLAYIADIPISQIGRIERGEINTTISTISALAKALEIHPSKLLLFD